MFGKEIKSVIQRSSIGYCMNFAMKVIDITLSQKDHMEFYIFVMKYIIPNLEILRTT